MGRGRECLWSWWLHNLLSVSGCFEDESTAGKNWDCFTQILLATLVMQVRNMGRPDWPSGSQDLMKLLSHLHCVHDLFTCIYTHIHVCMRVSKRLRKHAVQGSRGQRREVLFWAGVISKLQQMGVCEGSSVKDMRFLIGQLMELILSTSKRQNLES